MSEVPQDAVMSAHAIRAGDRVASNRHSAFPLRIAATQLSCEHWLNGAAASSSGSPS
jgi:hypothetical protein